MLDLIPYFYPTNSYLHLIRYTFFVHTCFLHFLYQPLASWLLPSQQVFLFLDTISYYLYCYIQLGNIFSIVSLCAFFLFVLVDSWCCSWLLHLFWLLQNSIHLLVLFLLNSCCGCLVVRCFFGFRLCLLLLLLLLCICLCLLLCLPYQLLFYTPYSSCFVFIMNNNCLLEQSYWFC